MIVDYNHCIHCDKYIKRFDWQYLIETIYSGYFIEKRYCCQKCYIRFYKFKGETNDWKRKRNI